MPRRLKVPRTVNVCRQSRNTLTVKLVSEKDRFVVCRDLRKTLTITGKLCYRKDDREPLRRYGHSKFIQDGGGRHLEFIRIENSAIRSAVPENPTL